MGMETVYTEGNRLGNEALLRDNLRQVMPFIDFTAIVKEAWQAYDNTREIVRIVDISAKVSTNHVYRVTFSDKSFIIAKLSYYGQHEHFVEDHSIINSLSN